ncbi:MAG TPA: hypothetical protein VNK24_05420 [Elusimicrobiota bacterium]|nr:hypothetical protein [Elusimicrobiota bacterium]
MSRRRWCETIFSSGGGQPVVPDVLRGKRRLTRKHIERLSRRFRVSPAAFYPAA